MRSSRSRGTRGFSSIVGAIFMVLIMWVLASSYFVYTLLQNTTYNSAVGQMNQLDVDRLSESANVLNTTYSVNANGNVTVSAQIQNVGPSSIQFINIWIYVRNSTWTNYNFSKLSNANIQGGSIFTLNVNLGVSGVNSNASYTFASWLITTRGNVVALLQRTMTNNIIIAQVSQGIGSISFNFEQFWHYDFGNQPADGIPLPSKSPNNYTISANNYTVFHVVLTDLDPLGKNIVLDGNSSIYFVGMHGQGGGAVTKYAYWNLVNVTNNKIYPSSGVLYNLAWGLPTELYFANSISQINSGQVYPLNILLWGTKGNSDYGQNIPFISIYLVP
jgi:FlaG/FlaF family flagellin (archaellin)